MQMLKNCYKIVIKVRVRSATMHWAQRVQSLGKVHLSSVAPACACWVTLIETNVRLTVNLYQILSYLFYITLHHQGIPFY